MFQLQGRGLLLPRMAGQLLWWRRKSKRMESVTERITAEPLVLDGYASENIVETIAQLVALLKDSKEPYPSFDEFREAAIENGDALLAFLHSPKAEQDIIRDTIMERLGCNAQVAQEIADLIRERIEKDANVFQEHDRKGESPMPEDENDPQQNPENPPQEPPPPPVPGIPPSPGREPEPGQEPDN